MGDAPFAPTLAVVERMCAQQKHRRRAIWLITVTGPAAVLMAYLGRAFGAGLFACYVITMVWYYRRRAARKANPLDMSAVSSLAKNMHVLVGGETLARAAPHFDWKVAVSEWTVPATVDVVVFDVDNVLDDFARFAFAVSQGVVVPATLNMFDFERLCVDPRNNPLFDFLHDMPAKKRPAIAGVVFNRVKCVANQSDDEAETFGISASDRGLREKVEARFAEKGTVGSYAMVRELPPSVMNAMFDQRKPIAMLENMGATLDGAKENFARVAKTLFA